MAARKTAPEYRKDKILGIVVHEYIKTVTPVSSGHIVKQYSLELSPATVRNVLAELEKEGLLTHPHTSAGRIPTQRGYRYYVDNLMHEIQLLEEEKGRIRQEYEQDIRDLELLLDKTTQVVSQVTQYTSIVSVDGMDNKIFCRGTGHVVNYIQTAGPEDIQKIQSLLLALEEKEKILSILNKDLNQKIEIYIGHEMACSFMEECSLAVSRYRLEGGPSGRIAVLGPTRMDYPRVVSTLEYVSELMQNAG